MEDLLYQYNPWWEGQIDLSGIRPRKEQLDKISSLVSEKRVVFLTGLRRVGKTTLMHLFVDQLVRDGLQPVKIFYVSLDDYLLRNDAIVDIVATYRKIHKLGVDRSVTLLLDEITYKENYQQQLKNLVDRENVTILASASSSSLLRDQKAFLTGRSATIEIRPLSFPEYMTFKKIHISKRDQNLLDTYFKDYLRVGGLPENVLQPSREYLMTLVDDVIQKDITAFHSLKDPQVLRDYFTLLMERSGKKASINRISNILRISPDTSRRYLSYFEETYLIHLLSRWGGTNERLLSPKKVYACDLGIKYLFNGERDLGSYFENYVYLQLRSQRQLFYLNEKGVEMDFLTEDKTLIEVKYNTELRGEQLEVFNAYPAKRKYLIDSVRSLSVLDELSEARHTQGVVGA
jgi:predicted AAA+ superfamily ATPase